jgi:hypothetical protein
MHIQLNKGRITTAGLWWATGASLDDPEIRRMINQGIKPMIGAASIGNAVENKVLDHLVANATYTAPTPASACGRRRWTTPAPRPPPAS